MANCAKGTRIIKGKTFSIDCFGHFFATIQSVSNFLHNNRFRCSFFTISLHFICSSLASIMGWNAVNLEFLNTQFQPVQIIFNVFVVYGLKHLCVF
jgi:hypothetical protein